MLPAGEWDPNSPPDNPVPLAGNPPISFQDINLELKKGATTAITLNDSACRLLAAKPSGAISFYDFYGKFYRAVYRPTAFNGVAGANAAAYDGGTITGSYNAEPTTTTTTSAAFGPASGTFTFTGLPTALVSGTLRVRAVKWVLDDGGSVPPPDTLAATLQYSVSGGAYVSLGTLTTTSTEFAVALSGVDPNTITVRTIGSSGSGGSIKLATDWAGHTEVAVYDVFFSC